MSRPPISWLTRPVPAADARGRARDRCSTLSFMWEKGNIVFVAHDDRGEEILDELEERLGHGSERRDNGERSYFLTAKAGSAETLVETLDQIAPDWGEHVSRQ